MVTTTFLGCPWNSIRNKKENFITRRNKPTEVKNACAILGNNQLILISVQEKQIYNLRPTQERNVKCTLQVGPLFPQIHTNLNSLEVFTSSCYKPPTTYQPPTNHLPTTYQPPTNHLPTTYWPPTDHNGDLWNSIFTSQNFTCILAP